MILKVLFWIAFALDVAAIGLIFVLSLAAAGPSKTNPLTVVFVWLVVPGIVFAALAFWFIKAQSPPLKLIPLIVVLLPVVAVASGQITTAIWRLQHPEEANKPTQFRPVSLAAVESAVLANDADAVKRTAAEAGLKDKQDAAGVIILAIHRLEKSPEQLPVFRALLELGANPDGGYGELPLAVAIRASAKTGDEPVSLLLDAGAKPNSRNALGDPAFFAAIAKTVNVTILKMLLDRGAEVNAKTQSGNTPLALAVSAKHWPAVRLLLERGADLDSSAGLRGDIEAQAKSQHGNEDFEAVLRLLKTR